MSGLIVSPTSKSRGTKQLSVALAGELALGTKAEAVVLHAVVLDLGVVVIGADFERDEVT
jgi:hypothetical protein